MSGETSMAFSYLSAIITFILLNVTQLVSFSHLFSRLNSEAEAET